METITRRYSSWGEFVDFASRPRTVARGDGSRRKGASQIEFAGTATFGEAVKLAIEGWDEGTERVRQFRDALYASIASKIVRTEFVPDVEGVAFDVGQLLTGEPEHWFRPEEVIEEAPGRVVRIVFNISASGGVSADVMIARGAATAALAELLEIAGNRCEVILAHAVTGLGLLRHESYVTIKRAENQVDSARLAFALAHPATLRRLSWSAREQEDDRVRKLIGPGGSYGQPAPATERGDVYIGEALGGNAQWRDMDSAIQWVRDQLVKQGVILSDS